MTASSVCVGVVIGAKGVRGEVRIKSFTAVPRDVASYGPLSSEDGRVFPVKFAGVTKDAVILTLDGVTDRDAAEILKGTRLYVARSALPKPEDGRYYHSDLVGLEARLTSGEVRGKVTAVLNFGAGDLLEVARPGGDSELIPFSAAAIADVDLAGGVVTVTPLPGLFDDETEGSEDETLP